MENWLLLLIVNENADFCWAHLNETPNRDIEIARGRERERKRSKTNQNIGNAKRILGSCSFYTLMIYFDLLSLFVSCRFAIASLLNFREIQFHSHTERFVIETYMYIWWGGGDTIRYRKHLRLLAMFKVNAQAKIGRFITFSCEAKTNQQ